MQSLKMSMTPNEVAIEIRDIRHTISIINQRLSNLEQKLDCEKVEQRQLGDDQSSIESKLAHLQVGVQKLQRRVFVNKAPIAHQLADSVTGIIGLKESITHKHPILKLTWALLFCLGVGATMFFTYSTVNEYLANPTLTKVKVQSQSFYDYPPIVLCNDAWFDVEKATKLGLSLNGLKYSLGYWGIDNKLAIQNVSKAHQEFFNFYEQHKIKGLVDYYMTVSVDLEPAASAEDFVSSAFSSYLATNKNLSMKKVLLPVQSACYAFSPPSIDNRVGMLQMADPIVIKYIDKTNGMIPVSKNWMLFLSSDANVFYSWPIVIRHSTDTLLRVHAQKFIALPKSKAPCVSENKTYSTAMCMADCGNRFVKEFFGCQFFWMTTGNDKQAPTEFCNYFDSRFENTSLDNLYFENKIEIESKMKDKCADECPNQCEKILYTATVHGEEDSWNPFPENDQGNNGTKSNTTVTTIEILHSALEQGGILTFFEISTYSFTEFVNNVGGTLGLFVGGTLMTVVQVVLFFVSYICDLRKKVTKVQKF